MNARSWIGAIATLLLTAPSALSFGEQNAATVQRMQAPAAAAVKADCEFIEIAAKAGDKPSIDAELKPLEKKLKKAPISTWNQFKLLSKSQKALTKKKTEPIALKIGSASATLVEIVDKSKVRLTVTMDDEKGKQVTNNTVTVEAADYVINVHTLTNNDGHLLSLTCK